MEEVVIVAVTAGSDPTEASMSTIASMSRDQELLYLPLSPEPLSALTQIASWLCNSLTGTSKECTQGKSGVSSAPADIPPAV